MPSPESIADLELSPRAYSALARAGILTIPELTRKTEVELRLVKGLGPLCLAEIRAALEQHQLSLAKRCESPGIK